MTQFSFSMAREEVQCALPRDQRDAAVLFETWTKAGIPQLLVLTDQELQPVHQVSRNDVRIRYYSRTPEALSFVGQFFHFIAQGLDFAYIDDWNNIHVFVLDDFMPRAYGFQHNNINALKTFLSADVHIYPSRAAYRTQIRQAAINRLLLIKAGVLQADTESIFSTQRGIFASVNDIQAINLDEVAEAFHTTYDFDQSMKAYVIGLRSDRVAELAGSLQAERHEKWTKILIYAAARMQLKLGVYHLSHGENNGESERVRIVLPDGATDLKFYEKPRLKRWNKVVVEKSNSAFSRLVTPYFLTSLHLTLTLREDSRRYLAQFLL